MIEKVNGNRDNEDSHWCDKTFGDTYIPSASAKRLNQDFANAVCSVQMQNVEQTEGKIDKQGKEGRGEMGGQEK